MKGKRNGKERHGRKWRKERSLGLKGNEKGRRR